MTNPFIAPLGPMALCQRHWDRLRDEIGRVGLSSLVAESAEEAATRLAAMLTEGHTVDNFEPFVAAVLLIYTNAMLKLNEGQGLPRLVRLSAPDDEGWCPICTVGQITCFVHNVPHPEEAERWIEYAVQGSVEAWKGFRDA